MKKLKPIAERISQWNNADEVIYRCPKCNCSFSIFGTSEKFCHNCGQEIDWNIIIRVNKQWSEAYSCAENYEKCKEMMQKINQLNSQQDFTSPMTMTENSIFWTCSICGCWGTPQYKYCPNCGAKMDGRTYEVE